MARIEFPDRFESLLSKSPFEGPLRTYADRVAEIVGANHLEFFPAYTDHGVEHISRVMATAADLIPDEVWEENEKQPSPSKKLFRDVDAAVLIGGTLLHDVAMHIGKKGFLELVSDETRFTPLPWFDQDSDDRDRDRPWPELWHDYQREAKRFSDRQLGRLLGVDALKSGWSFEGLPESGNWDDNTKLVVGEFLRRHHARLGHEIAVHGFPGLEVGEGEDEFPAIPQMKHEFADLADLIGLVARSHWLSLRESMRYVTEYRFKKQIRPRSAAVLFEMALLRVADFLQLDRDRAPATLLRLRDPQSPDSVREWKKHGTVVSISYETVWRPRRTSPQPRPHDPPTTAATDRGPTAGDGPLVGRPRRTLRLATPP